MKFITIAVALAVPLSGCAEVLDIPDDPSLVGPWRCLADPVARPMPRSTTAQVQVQACNFFDGCTSAVRGLTARVCLLLDRACTNAQLQNISDIDGLLTFEVNTPLQGFTGYLEVTSGTDLCTNPESFGALAPSLCGLSPMCNPAAPDDYCRFPTFARAMLFFNPPVYNDSPVPIQLPLIPAREIPQMLNGAGADLDPTTGNLFITSYDCNGDRAAGVTYDINQYRDRVTQLYLHGGAPNKVDLQTDVSGIGGFLGVPEGFVTVTGFNDNLEEVGAVTVISRPFTMTYSALPPLSTSSSEL